MNITREQIDVAIADASAVMRELDGLDLPEKFAAVGIDASDLADILFDRWQAHQPQRPESIVVFVQAWIEGMLTGRRL